MLYRRLWSMWSNKDLLVFFFVYNYSCIISRWWNTRWRSQTSRDWRDRPWRRRERWRWRRSRVSAWCSGTATPPPRLWWFWPCWCWSPVGNKMKSWVWRTDLGWHTHTLTHTHVWRPRPFSGFQTLAHVLLQFLHGRRQFGAELWTALEFSQPRHLGPVAAQDAQHLLNARLKMEGERREEGQQITGLVILFYFVFRVVIYSTNFNSSPENFTLCSF